MATKKSGEAVDVSDLISQAEAARLRGVTRAAIADLIRRGKIRSAQVAGRELVFRSEVEGFVPSAPGRPRMVKK